METKNLSAYLVDVVTEVSSARKAQGREPDGATLAAIRAAIDADVKETLNFLVREGILSWHSTVNGDPMFHVPD